MRIAYACSSTVRGCTSNRWERVALGRLLPSRTPVATRPAVAEPRVSEQCALRFRQSARTSCPAERRPCGGAPDTTRSLSASQPEPWIPTSPLEKDTRQRHRKSRVSRTERVAVPIRAAGEPSSRIHRARRSRRSPEREASPIEPSMRSALLPSTSSRSAISASTERIAASGISSSIQAWIAGDPMTITSRSPTTAAAALIACSNCVRFITATRRDGTPDTRQRVPLHSARRRTGSRDEGRDSADQGSPVRPRVHPLSRSTGVPTRREARTRLGEDHACAGGSPARGPVSRQEQHGAGRRSVHAEPDSDGLPASSAERTKHGRRDRRQRPCVGGCADSAAWFRPHRLQSLVARCRPTQPARPASDRWFDADGLPSSYQEYIHLDIVLSPDARGGASRARRSRGPTR